MVKLKKGTLNMQKQRVTYVLAMLIMVVAFAVPTMAGSVSTFLNVYQSEATSDRLPAKVLEFYVNTGSSTNKYLYYEIKCFNDDVAEPWNGEGSVVTTGIVAPNSTIGTTYFGGTFLPYNPPKNCSAIRLSTYGGGIGAIAGAVLYNRDANVRSMSEEADILMQYVDEVVQDMDDANKASQK